MVNFATVSINSSLDYVQNAQLKTFQSLAAYYTHNTHMKCERECVEKLFKIFGKSRFHHVQLYKSLNTIKKWKMF